MVKVRAKLLIFGKVTESGSIISEHSKINIPDAIPVTYPDHTKMIGIVESVHRDRTSLSVDMLISPKIWDRLKKESPNNKVYSTGYFNYINVDQENGRYIMSMQLTYVGLTFKKLYADDSTVVEVVEND